ncbi:MAG: hypothetical protein WB643_00325 [Candidatus Bathyarchaeia archaeon]
MRSAKFLLICLLFLPLTLALPHAYAQATSITDLTYDSTIVAGSLTPLSVKATVSYLDVPLNSTLVVAVLDAGKVPQPIVAGIATSQPDPCFNQPVLMASCDINPSSRSGQEQLEFKVGGILADQPQINPGTWNLNMTAAVFDSKNNLIQKSVSTVNLSITITGLTLTVVVPPQVPALVDGVQQPLGTAKIVTTGGEHNVTVPAFVNVDNATRLKFDHWSDGTTKPNMTATIESDTMIQAFYVEQYQLTITGPQSEATGEGWYDSGSAAAFAVAPTEAMGGFLGLLGGKMQFQGWYENGKLVTSSIAGAVTMDHPHTLTAQWEADYTIPIAILVGIIILAAVAYVTARKALRPRSDIPQKVTSPAQKAQQKKTRKRTPPARSRRSRRSR